ncbi:TPA: hypothetical protein ACMEVV_004522 [Klebsiella quasipneumoniae subsp. quasipneumoniae]
MTATYTTFLIAYFSIVTLFLVCTIKLKWWKLNHHNLFKQKLFWLSIGLPFITFIAFGLWVWWGKEPSLTSKGFERFLIISKLPLLFLAASVPLAAIVNNIHRTIQTEKQIFEAEQKNKVDNYYAHVKFYVDIFKSLPEKEIKTRIYEKEYIKNIKITHPLSLYKKIYPNSNTINGVEYTVDTKHIDELINIWEDTNDILQKIIGTEIANSPEVNAEVEIVMQWWYHAELDMIKICNLIGSTYPSYPSETATTLFTYNNSGLETLAFSIEEIFKMLDALVDICIAIIDSTGMSNKDNNEVFSQTKRLLTQRSAALGLDVFILRSCDNKIYNYNPPRLRIHGSNYTNQAL